MPEIALLSYPGVQQAARLGLADLFTIAGRISEAQGGASVTILTGEEPPAAPDIAILPPNISGVRGAEDHALLEWLRRTHARGTTLASVCAGAFWLGHAGLLDGRPVTTHWLLEDEFRAAFPRAQLSPERLLIDDHDIVTAGGIMAWIDLGLFFVERIMGPDIVTKTARHMLVDPRGREQSNWRSFRPRLNHGDDRILPLQHAIEAAPDADHSIPALANRAHLSARSLHRRFRAATGLTPNAYVQALRIEKARGMFERSRDSVARIAHSVGYEDTPAFTRLFRTTTGLTPSEYRARFGVSPSDDAHDLLDRACDSP